MRAPRRATGKAVWAAGFLLATALALRAEEPEPRHLALVIGNEGYAGAAPIRLSAAVEAAADELAAAGFRVLTATDMEAAAMRARLGALLEAPAPERLVILLAGHFAQGGGQSWFLGIDAERPGLATADGMGLPLSTVLAVAGAHPGGAVILLGTEARRSGLGQGLAPGIGPLTAPQGVAVIWGELGEVIEFAERGLTRPERSLPELLADWPDLRTAGFLSPLIPFLGAELPPGRTESVADTEARRDRAAWAAAVETDSLAAYRGYLEAHPEGRFAAEAAAAADRIANDPERIEAALNLDRERRLRVQRDLETLGFSTGGVDGIFGPATRAAIRGWQALRGLDDTGFLTVTQVALLDREARVRTAEREQAERRAAAAAETADRDFWRDAGAGADEVGLRAYLVRFPEGLYADLARGRLTELATDRDRREWQDARAADTAAAYRRYLRAHPEGLFAEAARARLDEIASAAERAAWAAAGATDTAEGYRGFLESFPDSVFGEIATARLSALEAAATADPAVAAAEERSLGLNTLSRSLIETHLQLAGLEPGTIDGRFDTAARRALSAYQQTRDLPATGFVSRDTLRRMIDEGLPMLLD